MEIGIIVAGGLLLALVLVAGVAMLVQCYQKVQQGTALVRTGIGGVRVSFTGLLILPVVHRKETMDISLKRVEIYRHGSEGLICADNVRADIKVAFFVRVNNAAEDVLKVAQTIGCARASDEDKLRDLFDAKFSEALKTVGKQFEFTDLYSEREQFKERILGHIGQDLNGYILDDAAIDYLEQTPVEALDPDNILDAEGIKKITERTATQLILANSINREREKTIKKQDVEAREAILELERQQAEAEARQKREIEIAQFREQAEADKVREEEKVKSERARLEAEELLGIQEQNKLRAVLIAERAKQRADAVEAERVKREQELEQTERERVVELARIEKLKAVEIEQKKIQDVIRERVAVQRAVVEEEERINDTREFAAAERAKGVKVKAAEAEAEEAMVKEIKAAEAAKSAAKFHADQVLIDAEARRAAAEKEALATMKLAEAKTADAAAEGLAEAQVMEAKAGSIRKYGESEAEVIAQKGRAEAEILRQKGEADAGATRAKAEAMKVLDGVGRDHEEFKLRLNRDLQVELAQIDVQKDIAEQQARVLGEALKSARIDIVGGENRFFEQIVNSITLGKSVERTVENSPTIRTVRDTFFTGDGEHFRAQLQAFVDKFGVGSEDLKNLGVAALAAKLLAASRDDGERAELRRLMGAIEAAGLGNRTLQQLGLAPRLAAAAGGLGGGANGASKDGLAN